jgi:putative membrane protein
MSDPASSDGRFRDHAANERTMLAWIRTGIALMAFGFAIARFALFLREIAETGQVRLRGTPSVGSAWFGVVLVVLGLVTNAAATVRYAQLRRAIAEGSSAAPSAGLVHTLAIGSALVAVAMAAILARTIAV